MTDGRDDQNSAWESIERFLEDARATADLATPEDYVILDALQTATTAARRKGYSGELLHRVLEALIEPPDVHRPGPD